MGEVKELPVPESLRRTMDELEDGSKTGYVEGGLAIAAVERFDVDIHPYTAEYLFNKGNVVVHFFRKAGGLFPGSFRNRIINAFTLWPGSHNGIEVDWVDEVQSWCVIVRGGGVTPPGSQEIEDVIKRVVL